MFFGCDTNDQKETIQEQNNMNKDTISNENSEKSKNFFKGIDLNLSYKAKDILPPEVVKKNTGGMKYLHDTRIDSIRNAANNFSPSDVLESDIQDDKENFTRFLVFQKDTTQPEFKKDEKYITSFLFKLKNKPAALFQALTGMSLRSCDMTKLQSFPEKGTFSSYYFICECVGHISQEKVAGSLKDLELHCTEFQLLGVFKQDSFRHK